MKSLEEFNNEKRKVYDEFYFNRNKPCFNGIACPECGCELVDDEPNVTLTSNPPQKSIMCPNCKYRGTRIA